MKLRTKGVTVLVAFVDGAPVGARISGPDGQWAQWGDMNPVERVTFEPRKRSKRILRPIFPKKRTKTRRGR